MRDFVLTLFVLISHVFGIGAKNVGFQNFVACLHEKGMQPSQLILRNYTRKYEELNYQWHARLEQILPLVYVLVESEQDVVSTVKCGRQFDVKLVPKSGGHSYEKYSFGDSESVIIDLRLMTQLRVNEVSKTAIVGPGHLIGPLAWKLWNAGGYFIPFGVCPTVGITGIAVGGGYGNFAREYGLTIDQLLQINIVISNGSLLGVNDMAYSDLFWALRGGGSHSFGIITKLEFKIHPAPPKILVWNLTFNMTQFVQVYDTYQSEATNFPRSVGTQLNIYTTKIVLLLVDARAMEAELQKIVNLFPAAVNNSKVVLNYPDFMFYTARGYLGLKPNITFNSPDDFVNLNRESDANQKTKIKSFYIQQKISIAKILLLKELCQEMPQSSWVYFIAQGGAVGAVGKSDTAFVHRSGALLLAGGLNRILWSENSSWDNISIGNNFVQKFYDQGKEIFGHTGVYQNYVDHDLPDYLQRYYGSNLQKLVKVKQMYDPENYFAFPQSIPTEIS